MRDPPFPGPRNIRISLGDKMDAGYRWQGRFIDLFTGLRDILYLAEKIVIDGISHVQFPKYTLFFPGQIGQTLRLMEAGHAGELQQFDHENLQLAFLLW